MVQNSNSNFFLSIEKMMSGPISHFMKKQLVKCTNGNTIPSGPIYLFPGPGIPMDCDLSLTLIVEVFYFVYFDLSLFVANFQTIGHMQHEINDQ